MHALVTTLITCFYDKFITSKTGFKRKLLLLVHRWGLVHLRPTAWPPHTKQIDNNHVYMCMGTIFTHWVGSLVNSDRLSTPTYHHCWDF